MRTLSRREFNGLVSSLPLAAIAVRAESAANGGEIGVATSSFRELPRGTGRDNVDDIIRALQAVRASSIELAFANVEPAPPSVAPVLGGSNSYPRRIVLTPEQIAATNAEARVALRDWRLDTGETECAAVRRKFAQAGITIHACSLSYDDSFTDDEIDATFRLAKQLGSTAISSPLTPKTAARLAAFAERHHIPVAIQNQVNGNPVGAIDADGLGAALSLSQAFRVALDIGHVTASNGDALQALRHHRARVSHVLVKDRLRNGGASQPLGEGDTPIPAVMEELRKSPTIPALIAYDYVGLRPAVEEVKAAMAYCQSCQNCQNRRN